MKCVVHVGMQKCGSTSLQRWLFVNRAALLERGLLCPQSLGGTPQQALTAIGMGFEADHWVIEDTGAQSPHEFDAWKAETLDRFRQEIEDASACLETVVISHENLSNLPLQGVKRCMNGCARSLTTSRLWDTCAHPLSWQIRG